MAKNKKDVTVTESGEAVYTPQPDDNGTVVSNCKPTKPREPKDVRFRRLAMRRVPRAVKAIAVVANLANRGQYEYTPEQAQKIIKALADQVKRLEDSFTGQTKPTLGFEL